MDILNIDLVIRGLKINIFGVTNPDDVVFNCKNRDKEYNVVLKPEKENELVVSFYSIG